MLAWLVSVRAVVSPATSLMPARVMLDDLPLSLPIPALVPPGTYLPVGLTPTPMFTPTLSAW